MEKHLEFRQITGYENLYEINRAGVIRRLNRNKKSKPYKYPKIQKFTTNDYLYVTLCKKGVMKKYLLHRLLAIAFLDTVEGKYFVNHKDGIKSNNAIDNLEWCTRSENMQHCIKSGLNQYSINKRIRSKINREDAENIRELHKLGLNLRQISKQYPLSHTSISDIVNKKTWK